MSCKDCRYAKPLMFAVYCKADSELRDLPTSIGHAVKPPLIQDVAPEWCPLLNPVMLPDIETVSSKVHEAWMESKRAQGVTSRKAEDGEELMVPYEQLSEGKRA